MSALTLALILFLLAGCGLKATLTEASKVTSNPPGALASTELITSSYLGGGLPLQALDSSTRMSASKDGRYLVLSTPQSLGGFPTAGSHRVYLMDTLTQEITLVSRTTDLEDVETCESQDPLISATGDYVVFRSCSTNLDLTAGSIPSNSTALLVFHRLSKELRVIAPSVLQESYSVSSSGSVAFLTSEPLLSSDTNVLMDGYLYNSSTDSLERFTVAPDGRDPDGETLLSQLSSDGTTVVFTSLATNLLQTSVSPGPHGLLYVRDLQLGETRGFGKYSPPNGSTSAATFSGDGTLIAFSADAANLRLSGASTNSEIYVRSVSSLGPEQISDGSCDGGDSSFPALSGTGRFVAFSSTSNCHVATDGNGFNDIFLHDRTLRSTTRVSVSVTGIESDGQSYLPSIDSSGRFVVFESDATNLVAVDLNGARDVFLKDTLTGVVRLISADSSGTQANDLSHSGVISADGTKIFFVSRASNLVPGDTNSSDDVFLHDLTSGQTQRVSVAADGSQADSSSFHLRLSSDGNQVVFYSAAANLVPGDTNNRVDVFIKDLQTGAVERFDPPALRTGDLTVSADAQMIGFYSDSDSLVSGDTNGEADFFVYDRATQSIRRFSETADGRQFTGHGTTEGVLSPDGKFLALFTKSADVGLFASGGNFFYLRRIDRGADFQPLAVGRDLTPFSAPISKLRIDGTAGTIYIETLDALISEDQNSESDVYRFTPESGIFERLSVTDQGTEVVHGVYLGEVSSDALTYQLQSQRWLLSDGSAAPFMGYVVRESGTGRRYRTLDAYNIDPATLDTLSVSQTSITMTDSGDTFFIADAAAASVPDPSELLLFRRSSAAISPVFSTARPEAPGAEFISIDKASLSNLGRRVAFSSWARNLTSDGNPGGHTQIFVRDRVLQSTTKASVDSAGNPANGSSYSPSLSGSGEFVVFHSEASNLVAGDGNGVYDVFIRDLRNQSTELVSRSSSGTLSNGWSDQADVSDDGRFVVFRSAGTNLVAGDVNGAHDIFLRDQLLGTTIRVSESAAGVGGDGNSWGPKLSPDGRFVVFASFSTNLVPGDTNAQADIFLFDRSSSSIQRVSFGANGEEASSHCTDPSVSADGSRVVFRSESTNLAAGSNGGSQIFLRNLRSSTTVLVSGGALGAVPDGIASEPTISDAGDRVGFVSSSRNLLGVDSYPGYEFYVRDLESNNLFRGSVSQDGSELVRGVFHSLHSALSPDGGHALFSGAYAKTMVSTPVASPQLYLRRF